MHDQREIVVVSGQLPIITTIQKMFTDRGWSVLAESTLNFSVEKGGKVFSCFLYPSEKVVAMRGITQQKFSEVASEPWCLVLTMEEGQETGQPIYVPVTLVDKVTPELTTQVETLSLPAGG